MSPLARINAIVSSPRRRYVIGEMEYEEYRALTEYETLTDDQKAAVDEMVRVCREAGQRAERIFPDLGAEVYSYPTVNGFIAWGLNSLNDGYNFKRGLVE